MEVITSHINADFDTLASMVAAKKLYPSARLVLPGSMEKRLRDAIDGLDIPFEIEKAKGFDLESVTRLIVVDIRQAARIGRFAELIGREGVDIHLYDHHPPSGGDISGSLEVTESYGSTSTILTLIIKERSISLTSAEATILMAGIYEDTGSLVFPSTTVKDFEAASFLLEAGADLVKVGRLLSSKLTAEEVKALSDFIQSQESYSIGGTEVVIAMGSVEHYHDDVAALAHRLVEIDSAGVLFLLAEAAGRVHVVARSSAPEVNLSLIAADLGGGGHPSAASATLKGVTLIEAREMVVKSLKKRVVPVTTAGDIMSAPVITIGEDAILSEAEKKILRYNVNAIVVTGADGLCGILTRQVAAKALYHGLGAQGVGDYMTTDFELVRPGALVDEVREKIFLHGQRLLPVMEGHSLLGVITRTDLLKLLQEELVEMPGGGGKIRNLKKMIEDTLPEWVFSLLKVAGATADELGYRAYAVGGFVRDILMRRPNLDIDIVVEGDGIRFAEELALRMDLKVRSHERFRTAVLTFPDGFQVDVATARLEYYEEPGALPTVELSSLKLDLYRRDFTINTLALEITPESFGTLMDFFGAQNDIKRKTVRVIHNLSFVEDPTRILRAVRFSERFGFVIAAQTLKLIKNTIKLDLFSELSGARVRDELKNILEEDIAEGALTRLNELGVLKVIEPRIKWDERMAALFSRSREIIAWYRLLYMSEPVVFWLVLFLALTDRLTDAELGALAERLSISGRKINEVLGARRRGGKALEVLKRERGLRPSEIYDLLNPLPLEVILYLMEKAEDEGIKKVFSDYITAQRGVSTILGGDELMKMGVEEGPAVGKTMKMLLEERLNGEIVTREDEEAAVRESLL